MKRLLLAVMLGSATLFMGGCYKVDSNFQEIRDVVFSELDGSYGSAVEVHLGGFPISMAGLALRLVNDEPEVEEALHYLGDIDEVEVGVYEWVGERPKVIGTGGLNKSLDSLLEGQGFELVVSHRERHESVSIYTVLSDEETSIRELFVLVVNREECVLVRLGGDLSGIMETAFKQHWEEIDWGDCRDAA